VLVTTTTQPPRPGHEPGGNGTGQQLATPGVRIRGWFREASWRKTVVSFS